MDLKSVRRLLLVGLPLGALVFFGSRHWLRAHGLTVTELAQQLKQGQTPRYSWQSVDKKHWQIVAAAPGESAEATDAREKTNAGCPAGMVRVKGAFRREGGGLSTGEVERLQDAACTDWISKEFPARCRTYDPDKVAAAIEKIPTAAMDYCIDRYEYPNKHGEYPMIVATFREAEATCKKNQKRLCTENEWTFACEGEEAKPYPYGYARDAEACVIDRAWRPFTEGALQPRDGDQARAELDHLWQGEPSGSRPACRSPFGVYDMTGNVDEWTRSVNPTGYTSILKGGYWGPVRARCRPSTRAHNEDFVAYQQSFRCCAESDPTIPPPPQTTGDAGAPDGGAFDDADAGVAPRAIPDRSIEWNEPGADEIEAIQIERTAYCSANGVGAGRGGEWLGGLALAGALAVARRRRSPTSR